MADKMMRVAGRGNDGKAKAINVNERGDVYVGGKVPLYYKHGVTIDGNSYTNFPLELYIDTPYIEIEIVASETNRSIEFAPVFTTRKSNFKNELNTIFETRSFFTARNLRRESSYLFKTIGDTLRYIRFSSEDGSPIQFDIFIWGLNENTTKYSNTVINKQVVAKEKFEWLDIELNKIISISNDGNETVRIGLNRWEPEDKIILKAGEVINDLNTSVQRLYYASDSGSQPIRIMGGR